MAKDHSADLMQALIAKLYSTITGNKDNEVKVPRNKFVSWMLPGVPFLPEDFLFCAKGLVGDSAEQTLALYHQAWIISNLLDFIPDVNNQFVDSGMQQTIFASTQDKISSVYRDVLKYSKVVSLDLTDDQKRKLEKFRNALTVTKTVKDILTDEERTVTEPGPLTIAYNAKMSNYLDAVDEYINVLVDAQSAKGNSSEAIRRVNIFANKAIHLKNKMDAADMEWVAQGYKNEFNDINAYINQVTQRSMVLYKQDLLNKFNQAQLTSPQDAAAGGFYYTTFLPGNFATSPGWTQFTYFDEDYETHSNKNTSQWSAGASANFGLFSVGAKANGSKVEIAENQRSSNFSAQLEFTQVPICRAWFDPGFFSMRGWTLDKLWNLNYNNQKISDGEEKPAGRLVAYPITALFVRNVSFKYDEAESDLAYVNKQVSAGASVGYGPFSVSGSYARGNEKRDLKARFEGGSIKIDGIQLIGFINNIIPNSPNPDPQIKPEQFV